MYTATHRILAHAVVVAMMICGCNVASGSPTTAQPQTSAHSHHAAAHLDAQSASGLHAHAAHADDKAFCHTPATETCVSNCCSQAVTARTGTQADSSKDSVKLLVASYFAPPPAVIQASRVGPDRQRWGPDLALPSPVTRFDVILTHLT